MHGNSALRSAREGKCGRGWVTHSAWDKPHLMRVSGAGISGNTSWHAPRHPEPTPEVTFLRHCVKEFVPSGPLETLPQDKPEEDFLVNKLRTPELLCEENLHCIHVLSCEWERRSLLQNFPVLTSPARLSDKWQCDHLAESMIFLLPFSDLIKIEVSLLVHGFIGQPSLEGGKTHPLGEIQRSNLKKTPPLRYLAPLSQGNT